MPHIMIKMYPGRNMEQKRKLAKRIVQAMEETIGAHRESVSLSFEEVKREDWDEQVVKPDIVDRKELLFIAPGYSSKYEIPKIDNPL